MDYKNIIVKIRRIIRSINLESKKIQKDHGVSIPQILCLECLKNSPNYQATQKSIRDQLNLNSSTITGIISRLEKKGMLARLPKIGDRRTTLIALTSKGDNLLQEAPDLLQQRLAVKLKKISDEELEQIGKSLDVLVNMLEIEDLEASPLLTAEDVILEEVKSENPDEEIS
ncbi:MarR family winged helix-turn-helix transcriptional regulator [Labilibaculum manganireducens]|uniref:MarR family transcriptional regulator n=1 Tax=Labilibaculum manganireducens TaxID=1940525 RepID=A0A2N3I8K1_9BACT|nr:MarR family transcriptional regulator [Labilibaculum manganireducens]PKQ66662.1 MarR family transcriptional regulator [Labilibaculum manganireducens]